MKDSGKNNFTSNFGQFEILHTPQSIFQEFIKLCDELTEELG